MINLSKLSSYAPSIKLNDSQSLYGSEPPGLPLLQIDSESCYAVIAIQGAQLLEFRTKGQNDLLWLSPKAHFETGKAIRGGIPICAPWFGPHPTDPAKPQHGFARNNPWVLKDLEQLEDGRVRLQFEFPWLPAFQALYPCALKIELCMTLGHGLELEFSVTNLGAEHADVSWALHSYHPISDLDSLRITGAPEDLRFGGEVDRLFEQVETQQIIEGTPRIFVRAEGSESAIIWNPGPDKARLLSDVADDDYRHFVCLERGAAGSKKWRLAPQEKRSSKIEVSSDSEL